MQQRQSAGRAHAPGPALTETVSLCVIQIDVCMCLYWYPVREGCPRGVGRRNTIRCDIKKINSSLLDIVMQKSKLNCCEMRHTNLVTGYVPVKQPVCVCECVNVHSFGACSSKNANFFSHRQQKGKMRKNNEKCKIFTLHFQSQQNFVSQNAFLSALGCALDGLAAATLRPSITRCSSLPERGGAGRGRAAWSRCVLSKF